MNELSDDAVQEIQSLQVKAIALIDDDTDPSIAALIGHVPALCATVRALRENHGQLAEVSGEWARLLDRIRLWSKCGDGYPLDEHINNIVTQNTALREQLAQAHSDNERLALAMQNVEEREAAICPEDVGFEEYIRTLKSRLTELENERRGQGTSHDQYINQ